MDTRRLTSAFDGAPSPLTRRERTGVVLLSFLVALTRWPAIAKSLWDWDEALFVLALRDYDVTAYHPHPPGFPLFLAAAKLIPLDPFHALQAVVVISSLFVFPAAYFLARELRADPFVSAGSSLLLAFLPNVWLFGGTAFSDVPSLVLSLVACALLLGGCRSDRALLAGCVVLGLAAGIRPQNLLIAAVPLGIAALARPRAALRGAVLLAAIVAVSYGAAARASGGLETYLDAVREHGRYIRSVDSFLSDIRPSLLRVADDFFLRPFRAPAINILLVLLSLAGLIRRRLPAIGAIAIFGPFLLFAWLFLDFHSASRFSIAYMPLFAILAAEGMAAVPVRVRPVLLAAAVTLLVAWTYPALRAVHETDSPPVAATKFIRATFDPARTFVDVEASLGPHAEVLLGGYERQVRGDRVAIRLRESAGEVTFARPHERLAGIVRPRYFEVSVSR